ncbi:DUF1622 domain-containing protein [Chachezhania sediminis]|uniref:DUF1622 domain-containing protein n=1 Tax=Chachezhania sediminis TaxID=2599291 RepID=UPI00131B7576|nr:DUF1622 domain-containing protein [Chachezhania sediminis]
MVDLQSSTRAPEDLGLGGLVHVLDWLATAIELIAVAMMLLGTARFILAIVRNELRMDPDARIRKMNQVRIQLGGYILSALELMIVSDLIHTALSLSLQDLIFLAALVAIRSVVSFFLDREIRTLRQEIEE